MALVSTKRSLAIAFLWLAVASLCGLFVSRVELDFVFTKFPRRKELSLRSGKGKETKEETMKTTKKRSVDDDDDDGVGGDENNRSEMMRFKGGRNRPQPLRPKGQEEDESNGFGCVSIENLFFVREMCLLDVNMENSAEYEGYKKMSARLTVRKKMKDDDKGGFEWSCGDSVRVAFETSDALFGPVNSPIFEEREEESGEKVCGEFPVEAIVPREGEQYRGIRAKVWLLHVDGEGLQDPVKEKPFPENLMAKANNCPPCDGPIVYNIRRTFPGKVYVDEKDYFVSENMEEDVGAGENVLEDAAGFTNPIRIPKKTNQRTGGTRWKRIMSSTRIQRNSLGSGKVRRFLFVQTATAPEGGCFPRKCTERSEEDALEWRYYGCKIKHVSGLKLNRCLEKVGPVKFAGESTLGHVYEAFLQHLNKTEYFWPTRHDLDARKVYGRLDLLRAQNDHSDFHGIDMVNKNLFDEIHNHKRTANVKFENVVILQGANDAARYSIEKFREKMKTFVETVVRYRETSNESEQVRLKRLVWVTAPTRQYKSSSGPGDSMCPNGSSSESMRTCSGKQRTSAHGRRYDEMARHRERYRRECTAELVRYARTKTTVEPNSKEDASRERKDVGG